MCSLRSDVELSVRALPQFLAGGWCRNCPGPPLPGFLVKKGVLSEGNSLLCQSLIIHQREGLLRAPSWDARPRRGVAEVRFFCRRPRRAAYIGPVLRSTPSSRGCAASAGSGLPTPWRPCCTRVAAHPPCTLNMCNHMLGGRPRGEAAFDRLCEAALQLLQTMPDTTNR